MNELTIADLYAIKSEAKEKEAYYRTLMSRHPEYRADWEAWKSRLDIFDKALVARIQELPLP